jgi:hypothetical protein
VLVAGHGSGLNDVNVLAPDILPELYGNLSIRKPPHHCVSQRYLEIPADLFRQGPIGIADKDF